ncbi:hypothetical protein Tco_0041203, partial [Tanacetum coccineum]
MVMAARMVAWCKCDDGGGAAVVTAVVVVRGVGDVVEMEMNVVTRRRW